MPRRNTRTQTFTEIKPGYYRCGNSLILDAQKISDHKAEAEGRKEDSKEDDHPEEDRQHAPHEDGGTEGST